MPTNPFQRKPISLEKLKMLRKNLREAYKKSTGEELPNAKNKSNPFYIELIDDISLKTNESEISPGTIQKFLYDDGNRNYQIFIIQMIERYISIVMGNNTQENERNNIESKSVNVNRDLEIKMFANRIYIELITRKVAIPIDEDSDVIEEIYNSWYKLFCIIREEIKTLPVDYFNDIENANSVIGLAMKILNEILRPHLTEHQAKFRKWIEDARQELKNRNLTPQELQRKYPDYNALMMSLKDTNKILIDNVGKFIEF
jgi:hypothetical protein